MKRLFTLFGSISYSFFPQFHNRNLGLIATSIHLIKLLDRMPIKGEPLLTGKDVNFVKYIVCAVFFMWEVMWYDVTLLIGFFHTNLIVSGAATCKFCSF